MEDDDEFGDLYTDVLTAFPCSSSSSQPPPAIESKTKPPQFQHHDDADAPRVFNLEADEAPNSNFGVEDDLNASFDDLGSEPVIPVPMPMPMPIPGLDSHSGPPAPTLVNQIQNENDDDDWDSDSEDDLQIVLNDNNHGPIGMDPLAMSDDEDEDGEPLIIVADAPPPPPSQLDDQDWADDAAAAAALPADAKDPSDALKPNAPPLPSASKVSYPNYNHSYHPFHSQFKYVRPGATPLPGGLSVASGAALSQVRPQGPMPARARPDWRPPNIKPPHKGFHPPFWPTNMPARGLEFTLPSHKTIFDVDIDSFEEKPWKYPGVDVSDFFNFGLNEDSWKEYCKQLEQLRLESTMQSKIRVYESGRAEQEYDPDMPPELAAAAGIHDSSAENTDIAKADAAVADLDKGSLRVRPPLPTGRPIQVETGCGERLPSVDTRPPRLRDSDAVIEIVLQCSLDDVSVDKGANEHSDNDSAKEDNKVDVDGEDPLDGDEYFDGSQGYGAVKEDATGKRSPIISSCNNDTQVTQVEERDRSPQRTSSGYHSDSRGDSSTENIGSPYEKRWTKEMTDERSPHMSSGESVLDGRSHDHHQQEDSTESVDDKNSPVLPSPNLIENAQKPSLERNVTQEKDIPVDKKPVKVKDDNAVVSANTSMDEHSRQFTEHQKPSSPVEPPADKEVEDGGDFKASRSSDNSKATGSSRDHHKWREGVDEEEVQNGHSTYIEELKRRRGVGRHDSHRKDRDGRMEVERNYMSSKGKDEYYPYRDWDPYAAGHVHIKSEGIDRRKERDYSEVSGQWRDEDARNRRGRAEDVRKQDSADEMISRHRGKTRDIDRSEKDDYLHSRKLLDSGSWRGYRDKDVGLHYKEKDNSLKRHKVLDDHHSKRRKDEHVRRDHNEKEDMLFAHRESGTRRKRERDDISNQRKRDDQPRVRDNMDDHHSIRYVDEVWVQRERAEQQRERDEWYRSKLSYEENLSRREREDGRSPNKSSRNVEEKTWVGHSRGKGEYKVHDKDKKRHSDPLDRMDWVEDDTSLQHKGADDGFACGVQFSKEGKRSRQERSNARSDHLVHAKDKQRLHEKKHKDNVRKARESEGTSGKARESEGTSGPSRRHQGGKDLANETADKVVKNECAGAERDTLLYATGESKDDVLSDDEQQQHGSKRGRSKLERWTSHKERDYATSSKLPSSSKIKEISKDKTAGCEPSSGVEGGSVKKVVDMDKNWSLGGGGSEGKDVEAKSMPTVDSHLDTVEKLKWRSERFKLPLTNEKDAMAAKKMESEGQPPQSETPANSQVKQERPARKRRWISS